MLSGLRDIDADASVTRCPLVNSVAADPVYEVPNAVWGFYVCPSGTIGQYIYTSLQFGSLTIYQVFTLAHNLAYWKTAWHVPPNPTGDDAYFAIDCSFDLFDTYTQQTKTADGDNPYWAVNLGEIYGIQEISFSPTDSGKYTVKPVNNDHLMGYFSAFCSSSRWPRAI